MPSIWTKFRIAVNPIARRFNQYTAYTIRDPERIGAIQEDVPGTREYLRACGYEPQFLSAAKKHPQTGQPHDLSYRRVPDSHPPGTGDKLIAENFRPQECQFHVHAFHVADQMQLFSHYEARPDLLSPEVDISRLRTHYRPEYGQEYIRGISDLEI